MKKPPAPIVGSSLLPEGETLSSYLPKVRDLVYESLNKYKIGTHSYEESWLISRALNDVGWNTHIEHQSCKRTVDQEEYLGTEFAIILDNGTAVSKDGLVGWSAIERFFAKAVSGYEHIHWEVSEQVESLRQKREDEFNQNPASLDCVGEVVSVLSKEVMEKQTPQIQHSTKHVARL